MARPLRVELAGGLYPVAARGDGREDIYFDAADRLAWLAVLGQIGEAPLPKWLQTDSIRR